ncbi:MAG: hypothetical protein CL762_00265, partial [Chloroflexi bacterium]|nr:hypothetical protein [Chloroflexota bacterium]
YSENNVLMHEVSELKYFRTESNSEEAFGNLPNPSIRRVEYWVNIPCVEIKKILQGNLYAKGVLSVKDQDFPIVELNIY